ncbi:Conserved oligomeric Golgi complex subunit 2 [Dissophora globulifera]|nr:Conserved oligomeric Golgi complex subunit 2 [Dissophora globulifera]
MMVNDIDHVASRLETIFSNQIRPKLPAAIADEPVLLEAFDQNLQAIRQEIPGAQSRITEVITKQCGETLVSNVKAMAARASEGPPSEASHFVGMILMPLERYVAGAGALVLKAEAREAWALEVVKATTKQYAAALAERLAEVRESEVRTEKLKTAAAKARPGGWPRLQNAFSSSSSSISSATGSQDGGGAEGANMSTSDKLRLQFVLDVRSYKAELTKFNIDPDTFQPYLDLAANIQPYESLLAAAGLD